MFRFKKTTYVFPAMPDLPLTTRIAGWAKAPCLKTVVSIAVIYTAFGDILTAMCLWVWEQIPTMIGLVTELIQRIY